MTGRINNWDGRNSRPQTAKFEDNPGENFGVLRVKRTILNQNSLQEEYLPAGSG